MLGFAGTESAHPSESPSHQTTHGSGAEMNDTAHHEQPTGLAAQPPATRMWAIIQKLSQARDAYARAKECDTRMNSAANISNLVDELRTLADLLMDESAVS